VTTLTLRPGAADTMDGMTIRVLVADAQPLLRGGLVALLGQQDDIEVVAEAGDGAAALAEARRLRPDLAVLDADEGTDVIRLLAAEGARVLVLSAGDRRGSVCRALHAGAGGFLLKDVSPAKLVAAVRAVAAGQTWVSPELLDDLVRELVSRPGPAHSTAAELRRLTPREREILVLVAQGLSNTEIAGQLFISDCTVKTHVGRILTKTGSRDRAHAVVTAYRSGLVRVARPTP
jgi:DNA-binding NarL/FixJ family response regulator